MRAGIIRSKSLEIRFRSRSSILRVRSYIIHIYILLYIIQFINSSERVDVTWHYFLWNSKSIFVRKIVKILI